jgi:hypothetical protein
MVRVLIVVVVVAGCLAFASAAQAAPCTFKQGVLCVIIGSDRSQPLAGTRGPDVIKAKGGNDQIWTGKGRDWVDAGKGNDIIWAAYDSPTVIFCGPGVDAVRLDWDDYAVGCEAFSFDSIG